MMKRWAIICILAGLLLVFSGCSLLESVSGDQPTEETERVVSETPEFQISPSEGSTDGGQPAAADPDQTDLPGDSAAEDYSQVDNSASPEEPVKLIFIHHSVGEEWLSDDGGRLGLALMENNYFVSDTNYGWGPDNIGDRTDIPDWLEWFRSPESEEYLVSLYGFDQNFSEVYSRGSNPDPNRENEIILFKSCYPNSNLDGQPDDAPADSEPYSVSHSKFVYQELLEYFSTRQDKLFVVITTPPVTRDDSYAPPENARAFNNWLVEEWLERYPYNNVAVFDFFNVLTSNGDSRTENDLGSETGNHHRWWNGAVQHIQTEDNDYAAYPTDDSHPNQAGNLKATEEFLPLLNVFYNRWKGISASSQSPPSAEATAAAAPANQLIKVPSGSRLMPEDLHYLGAFRLPDDAPEEIGWAWSGEALAFRPEGDSNGPEDGFPGSLFGTGHNWNQYVSEIDIPVPIDSREKDLDQLNTAKTLQPFQDIRGDLFGHLDFELPRAGLAYMREEADPSGGLLYFCWGQHIHSDGPQPSHGWSSADLESPEPYGPWSVGDFSVYSTSDYLFPISESWSSANTPGMTLATGRFRDGGWSGHGPALIAYDPGDPDDPPPHGASLPALPLLLYGSNEQTSMRDYHQSDEWSGAAWLEVGEKSAVIFIGTKGVGDYWYGFSNGVVWPEEGPYPKVPDPPHDDRGWWSSSFEGLILFFDPMDLAAVAQGLLAPHEPQPYAALVIDPHLFHVHSEQQKYHLGAAAADNQNGFLYLLEPLVDQDKPIIHVWRIS